MVNLDVLVVVGGFSTKDVSVVLGLVRTWRDEWPCQVSYMNVISVSASDFDGVMAGCSCRVLSRRKDSGTGPCQLYQLVQKYIE